MSQSDIVNTSPSRRWFPRDSRKQWLSAAAVCFIGAAYLFSYEKWPVTVTAETPLYVASRDGKQGVVTTGGRIVVGFEWEEIGEFDDQGMAVVVKNSESIHLNSVTFGTAGLKTGMTGVIDRTGRMIIPAELTERPKGFDDHDQYVARSGSRLVIYDRSGQS